MTEINFLSLQKNGFETQFIITLKKPCERYEFDIKNKNMSGHWIGVFSTIEGGTQIEFTEQVEVTNLFLKLLIRIYLKKQQASYISDLRKALGE